MSEIKQYIQDKDTCQRYIDKFGGVCSGCGGGLEPIETVDNSDRPTFWAGCMSCSCFDNGVDRYIYEIAKQLVDNHHHVSYSWMERPSDGTSDFDIWRKSQIKGATYLVRKVVHIYQEIHESSCKHPKTTQQ